LSQKIVLTPRLFAQNRQRRDARRLFCALSKSPGKDLQERCLRPSGERDFSRNDHQEE
jgi:hypothetical protein